MPQPKGVSGNPAGKPIGTKNKITSDVRSALQTIFEGIAPEIPEHFKYMNRVDKLNFVCKILPYICPKMESDTISKNDDGKVVIEWQSPPQHEEPKYDYSKLTKEELYEIRDLKVRELELEKKCRIT